MRKIRIAGVLLSLALVAAACKGGGGGGNNGGGTVEGGILRLGTASSIDSLNPFKAFNQDAYNAFFYMYPFLVQFDQNLNIVGDFAKDWQFNSDHTGGTFHTVSGGTWSDGKPLTANDAAYTINLILKYPGPTGLEAGYAKHIASAEATDPNTLVISYEEPVNESWALAQLELIPIMPQQVWSQHEGNGGKDLQTFRNDAPVVCGGPFILTQYQKRDIAQFQVNKGFYGPKPHIDGFGMKFYTSEDAMMTAFLNGELDAVEGVPPSTLARVKGNPNMAVMETQGMTFDELITNSNKPLHPELLNPQVREAFAHAIDQQQIVDVVQLGHAQVGTSIVAPVAGMWHDPNIKPATHDMNLANQLLDQLGYTRGSDGIRVANGHPMSYQVLTPDDVTSIGREFEILKASLQQIGVKLTQKSLDSTTVFDVMAAPDYVYPKDYDKYDLAIWQWTGYMDPDFILSVLTCQQWGFWNDSGYCNTTYDKLYEQQGVTVDQQARKQIVWQMQEMIATDRPYIVLDYRNALPAHTTQWDGFVNSPLGVFNNLSKATMLSVHRVSS